jgi:hypothetical protein
VGDGEDRTDRNRTQSAFNGIDGSASKCVSFSLSLCLASIHFHLRLLRTLTSLALCAVCRVQQVSLYLSFSQDESYTPCQMTIRVGTTFHDLRVRSAMITCICVCLG